MDDSAYKPITFAFRTFNAAEENYLQLNKESANVMYGLKKFHK